MKSRAKQFNETEVVFKSSESKDIKTGKKGKGNTKAKLKFVLWNVNGIRSILSKNALNPLLNQTLPDFICIN